MIQGIDQIMEQASLALAKMQYLRCQALCIEAMDQAYQSQNWAAYQRIVLPLQEAGRQKRMIALEGAGRLGTGDVQGDLTQLLDTFDQGFIMVTGERQAREAAALEQAAHAQQRYIQVLYAIEQDEHWQIQSFTGTRVCCLTKAPPAAARHRPLAASDNDTSPAASVAGASKSVNLPFKPADWFLQASELLGDLALEQIPQGARGLDLLEALGSCLEACPDHEIIHQRLSQAAGAMLH